MDSRCSCQPPTRTASLIRCRSVSTFSVTQVNGSPISPHLRIVRQYQLRRQCRRGQFSGIYVGWLTHRLNTPIVVSLWDASPDRLCYSPWIPRDVGASIGDNGFHAFTLLLPAAYQNGVPHTLQVRFEPRHSSARISGPGLGRSKSDYAHLRIYGRHQLHGQRRRVYCSGINGWVADRNRLNTSILVSLWDGVTQIANTTAGGFRPDVGASLGDNGLHGFSLQIPLAYRTVVAHTYQVQYESQPFRWPARPSR